MSWTYLFSNSIAVGLGGFFGATLRYQFMLLFQKFFGNIFPYHTLFVNVLGSILIGFGFSFLSQSTTDPQMKLLVITGFLGGLTTFSTFTLETIHLFDQNHVLLAFCNVFLNVALSFMGFFIGRLLYHSI